MWLFIDRRLIISCNPSNVPKELHWPWIITRKQNSSTSPCTFQTDDNRCAIFQIAPVPSPLTRRHSHELTCKKNIFPFLRAIFEHNHHIFSFFGSFCCFGKLFILRVIWNLSLVTHLRKRRRGGGGIDQLRCENEIKRWFQLDRKVFTSGVWRWNRPFIFIFAKLFTPLPLKVIHLRILAPLWSAVLILITMSILSMPEKVKIKQIKIACGLPC